MARRSFTVIDVTEILVHWNAGRPKTEVADSLGVDRKTVRKYLAPAEAAGFVPGGPPVSAAQWTERVREWFGGAGRHRAAAGVLAGDRAPPRVHQRGVEGRGDRGDGPSAAARRARAGGVGGQPAPVGAGEPARGGPPRPGAGAAPRRRRTWRGGPSRLRQVGDVARPGQRSAAGGVGERGWCWPARGTCSCARCSRWTSGPGPRRRWRRSRSSGVMRVSLPRSKSCEGHAGGVRQRGAPVWWTPCLLGQQGPDDQVRVGLGDPVVDDYLGFVAARCRPNTVLATA